MEVVIDDSRRRVFENSIKAMADFKKAFGRGLSSDFLAELYAADELGLKVVGLNQSGYDALGPSNERYQVKFRSDQTLNVDLNSFDFDYLVLVNLDENYQLVGMWRVTSDLAKTIFVQRPKYRRYQATQKRIKSVGERLSAKALATASSEPISLNAEPVTGRRWRDIRGAALHPLTGEDAQEWVRSSRQEDDARRHL